MEPRAQARIRSLATLLVLVLVLVVGSAWAWSALTSPIPGGDEEAALCTPRTVPAGEPVRPRDVTVSVLNASGRVGLASVTMESLVARGFGQGEQGNAPAGTEVARAQVWVGDPDDPVARLVASQFGPRTPIVAQDAGAAGITVVVGQGFDELREGRRQVRADDDTTVCVPQVTEDPALP